MNNCLLKNGTMGQWMMRNTASIQVNLDVIYDNDLEEMVFVADCLHPIAAYLFANCPYQRGRSTGLNNIRNIIWENTDNVRCRNLSDHGINSSRGLIDNYIDYVLQVPSIFKLDRSGAIISSNQYINEVLQRLDDAESLLDIDIKAGLHQIFTNVRIKNLVEVRGADRTPRGHEMAPVAFWTGFFIANSLCKWWAKIKNIKNSIVCGSWNFSLSQRYLFFLCCYIYSTWRYSSNWVHPASVGLHGCYFLSRRNL